ncbi:hypothetical protein JM946_21105 [Steroidobacter sp. S1-65]|uniref:Uncharacterized protein n=1 Tax=Steroidobacter gossypii TaxID=2805490 RepID=A0ABS1X1X0_9GAMM|nr:hypothetical protein [Steroidobacter gossypii]MBM0107243.1 hypothetical protein [Steroidobacter gossypii]
MGQHTQGPWIVSLDPRYPSEPCIDAVVDGVVWHVALCHNAAGPDEGCAEANARLIAAAPELLATLKDVLPVLRAELEKQSAASAGKENVESIGLRTARSRYEAAVSVLAKIDAAEPYIEPHSERS